jgi:SAM-dependent methyltransferase
MTLSADRVANVDQANAWDGHEGAHWAAHADQYDLGIAVHQDHLFRAAALTPTDHVIDIGCGNGASSLAAAETVVEGSVLGVDLSSPMLDVAAERARRAGLDNIEFLQADAQVHPFEPEATDVVISRFGAMFFADLVAAYANLAGALRPGGRLAVLAWQAMAANEWQLAIRDALAAGRDLPLPPPGTPGTPFGLADAERDHEILTEAGFVDVSVVPVSLPIVLGEDLDATYAFVSTTGIAKGLLEGLDNGIRAEALRSLRTTLEDHATADGVRFASAAWLITASKPG